MSDAIHSLIDDLARASITDDAFNEYAGDDPDNMIRRDNLRVYLETLQRIAPDTLLLMEAPGYRGCRLTGVPVTSRKVMLEGLPGLGLFGRDQPYRDTSDAGFERIYGEQSATIVWGTLADLNVCPLIWNSFPFHPHRPGLPLTNRKPRKAEVTQGLQFLQQLMALFAPQRLVAVGNVAHQSLTEMGLTAHKVRHPAQGGKNDFVTGLVQIFAGGT